MKLNYLKIRRTHEGLRADKVAVRNRPNHMTRKGDRDQYRIPECDQELHSIAGGNQESYLVAKDDRKSHLIASGCRRQNSLGESDDRVHFPETEDSDYTQFKNN